MTNQQQKKPPQKSEVEKLREQIAEQQKIVDQQRELIANTEAMQEKVAMQQAYIDKANAEIQAREGGAVSAVGTYKAVDGTDIELPVWKPSEIAPASLTAERGKLYVPDDILAMAKANDLELRWVNRDSNGRYEEAVRYQNYQPVRRAGRDVTAAGGGNMEVVLCAAPKASNEAVRAAKKNAIIDPKQALHAKLAKDQGAQLSEKGERAVAELAGEESNYVPDEALQDSGMLV